MSVFDGRPSLILWIHPSPYFRHCITCHSFTSFTPAAIPFRRSSLRLSRRMVSDEPHKIQKLWPRDPKGPILPSAGQPQGIRTPNGQIWGHDINDFYYIERLPGAQVKTVWSISMISEFGETYGDTEGRLEDDCLEPWRTRVRKPFPLLKFPDGIHCDQQIGLEDEGSLYCLNQASEKAEAVEVRKGRCQVYLDL